MRCSLDLAALLAFPWQPLVLGTVAREHAEDVGSVPWFFRHYLGFFTLRRVKVERTANKLREHAHVQHGLTHGGPRLDLLLGCCQAPPALCVLWDSSDPAEHERDGTPGPTAVMTPRGAVALGGGGKEGFSPALPWLEMEEMVAAPSPLIGV